MQVTDTVTYTRRQLLLLSVIVVITLLIFVLIPKVSASHSASSPAQTNAPCIVSRLNWNTSDPVGDGYMYVTYKISSLYPNDGVVGITTKTNDAVCQLKRGTYSETSDEKRREILSFHGQNADQIWFGPEIPGVWDGANAWEPGVANTFPGCADPMPGTGEHTCYAHDGDEVFQDDAGAIAFNGAIIHCQGIYDICPGNSPGAPNGVYNRGVEPPTSADPENHVRVNNTSPCPYGSFRCPIRGAGWFDIAPVRLVGDPVPSTIGVTMWSQNTWTGNYGVEFVISVRYPQREDPDGECTDCPPDDPGNPAALTCPNNEHIPDLSNVNVTLPDNSPDSGPVPAYGYGTYTDYDPQRRSTVNSVTDASSGGTPQNVPYSGGTDHAITLNYANFLNNYPFDYNVANVSYQSYYDAHHYSATGGPHWEDPPPYCTAYAPYTFNPRTGAITGGGHCIAEHDPAPYIAGYYFVHTGSQYNLVAPGSTNGPQMNPCWLRNYDTTSVTISQPELRPDRESPEQAHVNGSFSVAFNVTEPGRGLSAMRQASRVNNLPYDIDYQFVRSGSAPGGAWSSQTNATITITASDTHQVSTGSGAVSGAIGVSVEQSPGDLRVGDRVCWRIRLYDERGNTDANGNRSAAGGIIENTACSDPVVNWPYFEVYGNDVVSGGDFGTCAAGGGRGITTYFRPGRFEGSSTQYAAFALSTITGFTSASLKQGAAAPAQAPFGLSFANPEGLGSADPNNYGGGYTAADNMTCLPDYFDSQPDSTTRISGAAAGAAALRTELTRANSNPRNIEYFHIDPAGLPVSLAGVGIPNGVRKVFFVDGTLTIDANVTMSDTWSDRGEVPFVVFIARDIVIHNRVSQADGVFVAQPGNGGSGAIRTCDVMNFAACSGRLVINGALISDNLHLLRTRGSLRNARQNEGRPDVPVTRCSHGSASNDGTPGGNTCAAEIVNFSPEIFLALSQLLAPQDSFKFDSYVTLPPNL